MSSADDETAEQHDNAKKPRTEKGGIAWIFRYSLILFRFNSFFLSGLLFFFFISFVFFNYFVFFLFYFFLFYFFKF